MTAADYQREKDGYPDVAICHECGKPITVTQFCVECYWDLYGDDGAEES